MASRKSPSAPAWQAILERIEAQNRLTIEAVEAHRTVTEERFQSFENRLDGRIGNLELAVSGLISKVDSLEGQVGSLEGQMNRLETRFDALEARIAAHQEVLDRRLTLLEAMLLKLLVGRRGQIVTKAEIRVADLPGPGMEPELDISAMAEDDGAVLAPVGGLVVRRLV